MFICKWNNTKYSLSDFLVRYNFEELWGDVLKTEFNFWHDKDTLYYIVIEAIDAFEEILDQKRWYIEIYDEENDEEDDLNILLKVLMKK